MVPNETKSELINRKICLYLNIEARYGDYKEKLSEIIDEQKALQVYKMTFEIHKWMNFINEYVLNDQLDINKLDILCVEQHEG